MSPVDPALPNFFILGAAKCGTTSLFGVLKSHPGIAFSSLKEPGFFTEDAQYQRGLSWYAQTYFQGAERFPARGDGTTRYLYWSEKTAPRIQAMDADQQVRLVAIFRDPVERAYSMYWHGRRYGWETLPTFEDALAAEETRLRTGWDQLCAQGKNYYGYFREGCYAQRLQPFLDRFPRERILLLLFEDLVGQFDQTAAQLFRFLQLPDGVQAEPEHRNRPSVTRSGLLQSMLSLTSPVRQVSKYLVPKHMREPVKQALRQANKKAVEYPPMAADTAQALRERYQTEMLAFEQITGRDLRGWYAA